MHELRTWLLGVIFSAFAAGLAVELAPKGHGQAMIRLLGGAVMILALLRPLGMIEWTDATISAAAFAGQIEEQVKTYRSEQENAYAGIIAERLETYIWDKATELGLECTVHVKVSGGEGKILLPESVELGAAYDAALASWIEEVVGIPAEKQIWLEEKA